MLGEKALTRAAHLFLVIAILWCGTAVRAELVSQSTTESNSLTIHDLMPKVFMAYGGREPMRQQERECILVGKQTFTDENYRGPKRVFLRQVRKERKLRLEVRPLESDANGTTTDAFGESITVFDGVTAFKITGKVATDLPATSASVLEEDADHQPFMLAHWNDPGYLFKVLGPTSYKQQQVIAIEGLRTGHQPITFFVDPKNYLVVALSYQVSQDNKPAIAVAIEYSEYRPVGGTMIPYRQIQWVGDKENNDYQVEAAIVNTPVDDNLFVRPGLGQLVRLNSPVSIPASYVKKLFLVKVKLNTNESMDFIVDTGASQTIVDRKVAADTFLDKQQTMRITAASGTLNANTTLIEKFEIGGIKLSNVEALILDLTPQSRQVGMKIAGILGTNVLSKFAVVLDYSRPVMVFHDSLDFKLPANIGNAPFRERLGPMVEASLDGGSNTTFLIDTGASMNYLSPDQAAGLNSTGVVSGKQAIEGTGLDGKPIKLRNVKVGKLAIANLLEKDVAFVSPVDGLPNTKRNGYFDATGLGILGNPFLENYIVVFDYRQSRLGLSPNPTLHYRRQFEDALRSGDHYTTIKRDYRLALDSYKKANEIGVLAKDTSMQARATGRMGALYRVMAHDLKRPEHVRSAYQMFTRAIDLARSVQDRAAEGRILADWSLLYSDSHQFSESRDTMAQALILAPKDPQVVVDRAIHLYRAKQYPEMTLVVTEALSLDPSNWQALWYRLKLAEIDGDQPRQRDALKAIIKAYPWSKLAKEKLQALDSAAQTGTEAPAAQPDPVE